MRAIIAVIVSMFSSTASHAFERTVSVAELLTQTDVVVIGDLLDVKVWTSDHIDYGEGTIEITETLLGNIPATKKVILRWSNRQYRSDRTEYKATNGVKFIWLLWRAQDGTFRASSSSRKVNLDQKNNIVKQLKNRKTEQAVSLNRP